MTEDQLNMVIRLLKDILQELRKPDKPSDSLADYADSATDMAYLSVAKAFKHRYEERRQMEWHLPRNTQDCIDIARWINGQAKKEQRPAYHVGAQLLNRFFSDKKVAEASYPISWLAKDPGKWYRPAAEDSDPSTEQRDARRERAQERYQEALRQAEADQLKKVEQRAAAGPQRVLVDDIKSILGAAALPEGES